MLRFRLVVAAIVRDEKVGGDELLSIVAEAPDIAWPPAAEETADLIEWLNSVSKTTLQHLYVALQGTMLSQAIDSLNM